MPRFSFFEFLPTVGKIHVLDVGAAVLEGELQSYAALLAADRAHLYACEPDQTARDELSRHYPKNMTVLPHILGDGKPATWYETNWPATCSLFEPNRELLDLFPSIGSLTQLVKTVPVETRRLDECCGIEDCDFIKIDVQGAEIAVLAGGPGALARCVAIQAEISFMPLYKRQPLFADVDRFMREQGFAFHTFAGIALRPLRPMPFHGERRPWMNQYAWGDAVYVRDPTRLAALEPAKLLKLAALLHEFWESYDLAALALEAADQQLGTRHATGYYSRLSKSALL